LRREIQFKLRLSFVLILKFTKLSSHYPPKNLGKIRFILLTVDYSPSKSKKSPNVPKHSPKKEINLIWQTPAGGYTDFEFEYITEVLFADFSQNRFFEHRSFKTVLDNSVIIYSNNNNYPHPFFFLYLEAFLRQGFRFSLLHLSNENLNHNCDYYVKAHHVFRNYFDTNITAKNITYIPLGFQSGFFNREGKISFSDRSCEAAFIGEPKSDRAELIKALEKLDSAFIHTTKTWNCPTALSQKECIEIYKRTKYLPCPKGYSSPDSFRICEALEWGCIPILRRYGGEDYFQHIFPGHPFPTVADWEEISRVISESDYTTLSAECADYYGRYKATLKTRISQILS